jgi:small conductance mechanosensitive channel
MNVMNVKDMTLGLVVTYGFQVLGAFAILAVGFVAARWLGGLADQRFQKHMEPPMRLLFVRAIKGLVMAMAVVVALDKFGFSIAPLVAGIGVAGVGVGFAMQGVLGNLVAGLTIIFTKPFRVGEHIEILNEKGDVESITLSSTILVHPDRSRVIIPNRKIVGEVLHNFGTMRQLHLAVYVPHTADLDQVLEAARQVARTNTRVLEDPAPSLGVGAVEAHGIKIAVDPWVRVVDVAPAEAELYRALVETFRSRQIGVPANAYEVRLQADPRLRLGSE